MAGWNFAELWERIADKFPDATAQVQGERRCTWQEFDRRADGIAASLLAAGAQHQDKVGLYLYNCPEYMETVFACFKAGLVPVNTNYRYQEDELLYLWENADAVAVVFHGSFAETIERIREKLPDLGTWLWVDDDSGPCPDWARPYEQAADSAQARVQPPWGRDGDDILMLYTGGTTGMPKGVMWRQDDLIRATVSTGMPLVLEEGATYDDVIDAISAPGTGGIPACPLMHGTGWFASNMFLSAAGPVVTLVNRHFDVTEMLDTIERERIGALSIVGDAFAKPMLRALDDSPDRWDLSSLVLIFSSGVMWSEPVKRGLLEHHPGMLLVDAFSSSEALGMGQSVSSAGGAANTAKFQLGGNAAVITEDGRFVEPGSGEIGRVAVKGNQPIGYYKDPEKTAATFIEIDGDRYSMPGDYATVEADGSITLLGRGSVCINTAGEKVYPEEVEEVLKTHESVHDAVAVGIPDDKYGEAVTAVVEPFEGVQVDEEELIRHVKEHLAHYKAPRHIVTIETVGRAPNGKVDYKRMKAYAADKLGVG